MRSTTVLIFLAVIFYGCAPDITETDFFREHPTGVSGGALISLAEIESGGFTFDILAPDSLHVGHSPIFIEIREGSDVVTNASVTVSSRWVTDDRILEMPSTSSVTSVNDEEQFEAQAYFLQPDQEVGTWELTIDYEIAGVQGRVESDVEVTSDIWVQYVGGAGDYYVSWEKPEQPSTGNDDFEVALLRISEQGFTPVTDATIDLYPYMDMGAGEGHSTPFEKPVHTGDGSYTGMVNFIMSGGWDMTVYVTLDGAAAPDTVVFAGFIVSQ